MASNLRQRLLDPRSTAAWPSQRIVSEVGSCAGHYWSEIKNPITKTWRVINDDKVRAPTNERSDAAITGYLLFY